VAEVEVVCRPRVSIICCGDELTDPGQSKYRPGSFPKSISLAVSTLARRWGAEVVGRALKTEDLEELRAAAANAMESSNMIVVIGGASVGDKDFAKDMFKPLGLLFVFNKVAIKPGKPVWMGRLGQQTVLGLPSNPTSALVTAWLFLSPLMTGLVGGDVS
jgi:molybdopterin molybdotransferase